MTAAGPGPEDGERPPDGTGHRPDGGGRPPGDAGPGPEGEDEDWPPGGEPLTARSALGLRAALSGIALVAALAAAIVFAIVANRDSSGAKWGAAAVCAVVALIAATDLAAIVRRARH